MTWQPEARQQPPVTGALMGRLAQTEGLTDVQQEIVKTVREFVDKEILPNVDERKKLLYRAAQIEEEVLGNADAAIATLTGSLGSTVPTTLSAAGRFGTGYAS